MKITFHGGECCGIKHISGLGNNPSAQIYAKNAETFEDFTEDWQRDNARNPDTAGHAVNSKVNAFYPEAPKETYLERLDRYLEYLKTWRPGGIIEIVLCDYAKCPSYNQIEPWQPLLFERGFEVVNECLNSNSKNNIHVYHKVTVQD